VKYDTDGDELAFGRLAVPASKGYSALTCGICHLRKGRLFANSGFDSALVDECRFDDQVRAILSQKSDSESWKIYQALRESSARGPN
jgi:hypothetical protein